MTMTTSSTNLSTLLARAAEEAAARAATKAANDEARNLEAAKAEVAEALSLWGDEPCPARIHMALASLAAATTASDAQNVASHCLSYLGEPGRVREYLAGATWCMLSSSGGCGPGDHPATRAEHARREQAAKEAAHAKIAAERDAWLALPEERWFDKDGDVAGLYASYLPRSEAEKLGVVAEYEKRKAAGAAAKAAAEAAREERVARKAPLLTAIVQAFGDDAMRAARGEDVLVAAEIVDLLWRLLFTDESEGQAATWLRDERNGYGPCDVYHRDEKVEDVPRVSSEAYRVLRGLRENVTAYLREPTIAKLGESEVVWCLERITSGVRPHSACWVAYAQITIAGCLTVGARHVLAKCVGSDS
jgi:hypothetical protein